MKRVAYLRLNMWPQKSYIANAVKRAQKATLCDGVIANAIAKRRKVIATDRLQEQVQIQIQKSKSKSLLAASRRVTE